MSIDRATLSFLETLNRDTSMQQDLDTALEGAADPFAALMQFARARGFEVTSGGLNAAKEALSAASEMSEADLGAVSGGFNPQPEPPARISPGDIASLAGRFNRKLLRW